MWAENFAGRNNLDDGLAAYEHFLEGWGTDKRFNLSEYIREDPSGALALENAILEAAQAAESFCVGYQGCSFQFTSDAYRADFGNARFPYPETENWQKAIGGYSFWTDATVEVSILPNGDKQYAMNFTMNAEDRYNFNPRAQDIATGVPDSANGRFEISRLAHQYMHYGESSYSVTWVEGETLDLSHILPPSVPEENPSELLKWLLENQ